MYIYIYIWDDHRNKWVVFQHAACQLKVEGSSTDGCVFCIVLAIGMTNSHEMRAQTKHPAES